MAINRQLSYYGRTKETPIASGVEITDAGLVLVQVQENGVEKVQPSLGTSNAEVVVGFSDNTSLRSTTRVELENGVVPASGAYTVQLSKVLLVSGSLRVVNTGTNGALTVVTSAPSAGQVQVNYTTGLLTFNVAQAGISILATFRRTLSANEIAFTVRQSAINAGGSGILGSIAVIRDAGELHTDMFDTTVDYASATKLYAGVGGMVTSDATNKTEIPGSRMILAPTASEVGNSAIGATIGFAFNLA